MPTVYNKVTVNDTTYIDLSQDTVADASHIRQGYTGHLNDGSQVVGSYAGSAMNVQTAQGTTRRNNTSMGSVISLTCSKTGTYDVYWDGFRSSQSGTFGSQLYINGSAYDTENTTWEYNVQTSHLTGVTLTKDDTVAVYGRSRSGYYLYVPQLTIVQTA